MDNNTPAVGLDDLRKDFPEFNNLNDYQLLKRTYNMFGKPTGEDFNSYSNRIAGTKGLNDSDNGVGGALWGGIKDFGSLGLDPVMEAGMDKANGKDFNQSLREANIRKQGRDEESPWAYGAGQAIGALPAVVATAFTGGADVPAAIGGRLGAEALINGAQMGLHSMGQDYSQHANTGDIDPTKAAINAGVGAVTPMAIGAGLKGLGAAGDIANTAGDWMKDAANSTSHVTAKAIPAAIKGIPVIGDMAAPFLPKTSLTDSGSNIMNTALDREVHSGLSNGFDEASIKAAIDKSLAARNFIRKIK